MTIIIFLLHRNQNTSEPFLDDVYFPKALLIINYLILYLVLVDYYCYHYYFYYTGVL